MKMATPCFLQKLATLLVPAMCSHTQTTLLRVVFKKNWLHFLFKKV